MPQPPPRPRFAFPFVLLAVGLGLTGYFGLQWLQLPHYSASDIDASAELNLRLDLQRRGVPAPDGAALRELRARTRAEVVADIAGERRQVESGLGAGLVALGAALGNLVLTALLRRHRGA